MPYRLLKTHRNWLPTPLSDGCYHFCFPIHQNSVNPHTLRRSSIAFAVTGCIFFFCIGLAFIPYLGIESDESLFASALYQPRGELFAISLGHRALPLMLMTYLGSSKAWMYHFIFQWFGSGLLSLRVPMLLAGTASLWLFFLLLRRLAGDLAALIGCALLASDSMYLLTVCFDWGPVALQHLFLGAAMLLLVRFYQQRGEASLWWGCFFLGLALWDKALALWMLSGMGIAGILTFPRQVFGVLTRRRVTVAALGFLLGAMPLIVYNARNHWATFRGNFHKDTSQLAGKARALMATANGNGLFGWMTAEDWQTPTPHPPATAIERISADISARAGHPRRHLLLFGFLLALLLAPFAGRPAQRAVLFGILAIAVAWIQMAITANAGGSVHHTILLWPLPQFVIAISFAGAAARLGCAGIRAAAVVTLVMAASGALVVNEYLTTAQQYGGAQSWDDAIFALSDYVRDQPVSHLVAMDWGILDPLRMMHRGRLPLIGGDDPNPDGVRAMLADAGNLYIGHTPKFEFFPGNTSRLVKSAAESGFRQEMVQVIPDRYGRPVFEIFRFVGSERAN